MTRALMTSWRRAARMRTTRRCSGGIRRSTNRHLRRSHQLHLPQTKPNNAHSAICTKRSKFGEFSALVFGDEVSHVVKKVPKSGDFRVQGAFGATEINVRRADDEEAWAMVEDLSRKLYTFTTTEKFPIAPASTEGGTTADQLRPTLPPFYMRVDVVFNEAQQDVSRRGGPMLIEAEMIEPYLYFTKETQAEGCCLKLAKVLDARFN